MPVMPVMPVFLAAQIVPVVPVVTMKCSSLNATLSFGMIHQPLILKSMQGTHHLLLPWL